MKAKPFEQLHVLLVLQKRAVQACGRAELASACFQVLGAQILGQQQFQPVQHFRRRRLSSSVPACSRTAKNCVSAVVRSRLLDARVVDFDDSGAACPCPGKRM